MSVDTVNTITVTGAEDEVKKFRDAEVIPPEGQDWGRICVLEDTPGHRYLLRRRWPRPLRWPYQMVWRETCWIGVLGLFKPTRGRGTLQLRISKQVDRFRGICVVGAGKLGLRL